MEGSVMGANPNPSCHELTTIFLNKCHGPEVKIDAGMSESEGAYTLMILRWTPHKPYTYVFHSNGVLTQL